MKIRWEILTISTVFFVNIFIKCSMSPNFIMFHFGLDETVTKNIDLLNDGGFRCVKPLKVSSIDPKNAFK